MKFQVVTGHGAVLGETKTLPRAEKLQEREALRERKHLQKRALEGERVIIGACEDPLVGPEVSCTEVVLFTVDYFPVQEVHVMILQV